MWHLILARVEKVEVIPDNKTPKKTSFYHRRPVKPSVWTWMPDCYGKIAWFLRPFLEQPINIQTAKKMAEIFN